MKIHIIDRKTGKIEKEIVEGEAYLKWLYENRVGTTLLEKLVKKKLISSLSGKYMDSSYSRKKIPSFVERLKIDMKEAIIENPYKYNSFNEFFIRKLKKEARPIEKNPKALISIADGRVMAYENININRVVQIKGMEYSLEELVGNDSLASQYEGGSCVITRLNPSDYHRFHFPDGGIPMESQKIEGSYYSVNPLALSKIAALYCQNKREICIFKSNNFNEILMVEVGATCVGSIIQTYKPQQPVKKGEEKGYFKFGGSTTIIFLKKNSVKLSEDLIENTNNGYETKVKMGETIGYKPEQKHFMR